MHLIVNAKVLSGAGVTKGSLLVVMVAAALIGGTLDITAAFAWVYLASGTTPSSVLKFIASAITGAIKAFSGGIPVILLGLFLHYVVAFLWTGFFFFIYPRIKLLGANVAATAAVYGVFIWLVMNLLILPLTKVPHAAAPSVRGTVIGIAILIVAMGVPLTLLAKKFFSNRSAA